MNARAFLAEQRHREAERAAARAAVEVEAAKAANLARLAKQEAEAAVRAARMAQRIASAKVVKAQMLAREAAAESKAEPQATSKPKSDHLGAKAHTRIANGPSASTSGKESPHVRGGSANLPELDDLVAGQGQTGDPISNAAAEAGRAAQKAAEAVEKAGAAADNIRCLLYTSPSPRD